MRRGRSYGTSDGGPEGEAKPGTVPTSALMSSYAQRAS